MGLGMLLLKIPHILPVPRAEQESALRLLFLTNYFPYLTLRK